jgi:hypothetical protein
MAYKLTTDLIEALTAVSNANCVDVMASFLTGVVGSVEHQQEVLAAKAKAVHRERYGRSIAVLIPLFAGQGAGLVRSRCVYKAMGKRTFMENVRFYNALFLNKHLVHVRGAVAAVQTLTSGEKFPVYGRRRRVR